MSDEHRTYLFSCSELPDMKVRLPLFEQLCHEGLIDECEKLKLTLALQEALANALEHGNLELVSAWRDQISADGTDLFSARRSERLADPQYANRTIVLEVVRLRDRLVLSVKDQGKGFICGERSRTDGVDVSCYGRGLTIMADAVDKLNFHDNGTRVEMIKFLRQDPAEAR